MVENARSVQVGVVIAPGTVAKPRTTRIRDWYLRRNLTSVTFLLDSLVIGLEAFGQGFQVMGL